MIYLGAAFKPNDLGIPRPVHSFLINFFSKIYACRILGDRFGTEILSTKMKRGTAIPLKLITINIFL